MRFSKLKGPCAIICSDVCAAPCSAEANAVNFGGSCLNRVGFDCFAAI